MVAVRVRRRSFNSLLPIGAVALVIGLWELTAQFVPPLYISSPVGVGKALYSLASGPTLAPELLLSLRELYEGLVIGVVIGSVIGLFMGRYPALDNVLSPFVNVLNSVPVIILIPLFVVWTGIDATTRVLFISLLTLWPPLLNVRAGVKNVRRDYIEVGKVSRLSGSQLTRKVVLFGAIPYLFAGLRLSLALANVGMILSEMEVASKGIGFLLLLFGEQLQTGHLLALVVITGVVGVINTLILLAIQQKWFAWSFAR